MHTKNSLTLSSRKKDAVTVYCASSMGKHAAFGAAAISLGRALAASNKTLVYGGGDKGVMGIVSGAALEGGAKVIGIIPRAMVRAGGEREKVDNPAQVEMHVKGREQIETIVVDSMHERKVEMAKRSDGFIGLPGGFGTFEEVMEVITWTQVGIHDKPVVLLNVLSFWEPLRTLIKSSVDVGFIRPESEKIVVFVDGPKDQQEHEMFDWGKAALEAIDGWEAGEINGLFEWSSLDKTAPAKAYSKT